ncbi:uncharacterized protein CCOS01_14368 [Colletotrichum costaricense]|uniref:Uncharacterized protein n=2 Tax=Colletotrichum acutatum species complex TaxID=2707335 RepID=A0AAI9YJK4_9PEZI|nr:uncharacterized protein CCOS01_14368 [Colletotrichum costaricense]XP_060380460.1 uncharacterized protein CTAM01_09000 [Colletotrichum tamarilloi]KAK1494646.1 hypothetical protein CTAM01_09000 [Colletotrichum tamarilloi]KAK1513426.1 hypothetical protein CCOS01_14368 [Colletotrichum costaricense]
MNWADHFDGHGRSFIYEEDVQPMNQPTRPAKPKSNPQPRRPPPPPPKRSTDPHENIHAWLSGVTIDEEHVPLASDIFHALGQIQGQTKVSHQAPPVDKQQKQAETQTQTQAAGPTVTVHTMGPGFIGRAPAFGTSEFFANMVVVGILLLFAPGFTILAAGVFFTSRVAERWAGQE